MEKMTKFVANFQLEHKNRPCYCISDGLKLKFGLATCSKTCLKDNLLESKTNQCLLFFYEDYALLKFQTISENGKSL